MGKTFRTSIVAAAAAIFLGFTARAQVSASALLAQADSATLANDFPAAARLCDRAAEQDSLAAALAQEIVLPVYNGLSMMNFCSQPTVVAKQVFPLKDFLLFYPLKDRSWRPVPNQLDSLGGDAISQATYVPDGASEIYWSAQEESGTRNLYMTQKSDTLWSAPRLINEGLTSASDEIFPMLSPDGSQLYFASKGLYGMGGYDLYVSAWSKESGDWDQPVNMGFPYSSPYDDFLFINTEDGKYSIFASNRECSKDSVCIYVVEYDAVPVHKAISEVSELRELAALRTSADRTRIDNGSVVSESKAGDADTKEYMDKMLEVRALRDSVSAFNRNLDQLRSSYASASASEKAALADMILEKELQLPALNASLSRASEELQATEMEFLRKGVVLDMSKLQAVADKEIVGASSGYAFTKNSYGPELNLAIEVPEPSVILAFSTDEGRIYSFEDLPGGLVYQIQLCTQTTRASVNDIKGLSPVFERQWTATKKYTYTAGAFRTYKEVLSKLNTVRSKGFRDAFIVAWNDGQTVTVKKARELESTVVANYMVRIEPAGGSLSDEAMSVLRELEGKDITKFSENGKMIYSVGTFSSMSEASSLVSTLSARGVTNATVVLAE